MSTASNESERPKLRVVRRTNRRHRETRRLKGSKCLVYSPGNVKLLKKAIIQLQTVGEMNGRTELVVTHVNAVAVPELRKVYLWPTDGDDPDAYEATLKESALWVNLGPLLEEAKMALPVRHVERFQMEVVAEAETPEDVPNALSFDLNDPEEIKMQPLKNSKTKRSQNSASKSESKPEAKSASKPESKVESHSEAKAETKPDPKPETPAPQVQAGDG